MKKKYLTWAGILSTLILAGMFVGICLSSYPFPFLPPATTIDPITPASVDQNNMLILTGTTTLPEHSHIAITVSAVSLPVTRGNETRSTTGMADARIVPVNGGRNQWRGVFALSTLQYAEYQVTLATYTLDENYRRVPGETVATGYFTVGDKNAGEGTIRERTLSMPRFIRINPVTEDEAAGTLNITGITSLDPGTLLAWSLYPVINGTPLSVPAYSGTTPVTEGTKKINRWDIRFGTGALQPARYELRVIGNPAGNTTPAATLSAITELAVSSPQYSPSDTSGIQSSPGFITIDTLPDITVNNVSVITGTTSLPAIGGLVVEVFPVSFETGYNFSTDARETDMNRILSGTAVFSGVSGEVPIVKGNDGCNLWAFRLETYTFSPGQYQINVSNYEVDTANHDLIYGNLSSTRVFPVSGDAP
jgi:hypothetical protein